MQGRIRLIGLIVTPAPSPSLVPGWLPDVGIGGCELAPRAVREGDDIGYGTGPRPGLVMSYEPGSLHIGWGSCHDVVGMDRTRLWGSRRYVSRCRPVCRFEDALFVPCLVEMGEEVKQL